MSAPELHNPVHLHPNPCWQDAGPIRLSIILPCYNYAGYLPDAIASVIEQKVPGVELIIVNDGSTDLSLPIALKLSNLFDDFPILVIDQENQGQPAISRNNGILHARGRFILPLDADDLLAENAVAALLGEIEQTDDHRKIVTASIMRFGSKDDDWKVVPFDAHAMLRRNQIPYCSMYSRALWEEIGGYSINVPGYEDWDFWIGAVTVGAKVTVLPIYHLYYREASVASMMDRGIGKHEHNIAGIICNHPHAFEDEEVAWARKFRTLFPQPPAKRGFYGLDREYPRVTATIIMMYREYFSIEQLQWANEVLSDGMMRFYRGLNASFRPDPTPAPSLPGQGFHALLEAFQAVAEGEFDEGADWLNSYRASVDYDLFEREERRDKTTNPSVSVVLVGYRTGKGLLPCLDSLIRQSDSDFEIILVDNGGNAEVAEQLRSYPLLHIRSPLNLNPSEGRNLGVHFARGDILAMLDDDAIVPPDYIASIKQAFDRYDIEAFRGKVLPKSQHPNNTHARHYDFGDAAFPAVVDTEGNSAWKRRSWELMGGMHPLLFGHEGVELSYRLALKYGVERTIYWPETVIFHDYAASDSKLRGKEKRHERMKRFLRHLHPEIDSYLASVQAPLFQQGGREAAEKLIPRGNTAAGGSHSSNGAMITRAAAIRAEADTR